MAIEKLQKLMIDAYRDGVAAERGRRNREGERRQPLESAAFVERLMAAAERAAKADRHAPLWSGARAPRRLD